jgi:hypothetical protein
MAQHLVFSAFSHLLFGLPTFSGPSTTDETLLVEMRIWCIKIGIVLALHCKEITIVFKEVFYKFPCMDTLKMWDPDR